MDDNRVRFEINPDAKLLVSSKLLAVAKFSQAVAAKGKG